MNFNNKGFTLVETIIYAAIISVSIVAVLFAVYQLIESRYRTLARVEVEEEAQFIMGKIKWALNGIDKINEPAPNATSSVLSVDKFNFSPNPIVFTASGTDFFISYGGGEATVLNSESVLVRNLIFGSVGSPDNPAVEISFSVEHRPREQLTIYNASTSLRTIIYARKK